MRKPTDQIHKTMLILPLLLGVAALLFYGGAIAGGEINPAQLAQRFVDAYEKVVKEAEARGVVPDIKGDPTLQAAGQELERTLHGQPEEFLRAVRDELQKRLEPIQKAAIQLIEQKRLADELREKEYLRSRSQRPAVSLFSKDETVAERFDAAMKKLAERCAKNPPKPDNTDCDPLKLKPADPLATEEGRFAQSIKIPNPVPEDSGYKAGMTTKEYFEHLCKTEAGEFIFKTVEDVDGIMQMRSRVMATDDEMMHLYALEDPYNAYQTLSAESYVNPRYADAVKTKDIKKRAYKLYKPDQNYKFLENPIPATLRNPTDSAKYLRYTRPNTDKLIFENDQYMYPRDQQPPLLEERVKELKSRYGFTWRGIARPHDRELGIAGGEVIILDLQTNEVVAVRRGYAASGGKTLDTVAGIWWLSAAKCPVSMPGDEHLFIHKVLKPLITVN